MKGVDLEIFELEGKSKILTVKNVEYKENFKVNGRVKPKGIVMYFEEDYAKPLIVNTKVIPMVRYNITLASSTNGDTTP